jgi:tetratricopeptide (TPR) repeat protein
MGARCVRWNISCLFVFSVVFFLSATTTSAKVLSYIKEYSYQAGEADSKLSSRTIALEQVKRLLLEELGTYLISETAVKNFELTKDQISSLTAGIVMTVILDEKWDGKTYFLKAKITTETDDVINSINTVRRDQEQSKTWEEIREKTEEALKKIEKLRQEMESIKGQNVSEEKYAKAVNELAAIDWLKKGVKLRTKGKNNKEAMKAFDKAIEIDPDFATAYAGRAAIYNDWEQHQQALRESDQAIQLNPNRAWGFNTRGWAHIDLRNYQKAITDLNRAIELFPKYAWAYANRSRVYHILKNYQQALDDANKAIEYNPRFSNGYFRRGMALASLNRFPDAVKSYDKAIEFDPTFPLSFLQRGFVLLKLGLNEQALEDLKRAARLGNNEARSYLTKQKIPW